jgi:hypothetical protein
MRGRTAALQYVADETAFHDNAGFGSGHGGPITGNTPPAVAKLINHFFPEGAG